jgi:hypothetical protein
MRIFDPNRKVTLGDVLYRKYRRPHKNTRPDRQEATLKKKGHKTLWEMTKEKLDA